jgi:hypothetical protein
VENQQGKDEAEKPYARPDLPPLSAYKPVPPFPEALKDTRRPESDKEIFETFKKYEVNIPLVKLIKSIPRYAKFLKELCTIKRNKKLKGKKKIKVSEHVSAVFQRRMLKKCGDLGMFSIPCVIGDTKFEQCMLDLGASINVLPYSLYKSLELGPLHETSVVIQLADRSNAYPKGVVKDVLVMVDKLIFPADFFVLDMEHDKHAAPILLGRSFLKTAKTKIDVYSGSLSMKFDGERVEYNIYDAMKYLSDDHSLCSIDMIDPLVQDVFDVNCLDDVQSVLGNTIVGSTLDYELPTNL